MCKCSITTTPPPAPSTDNSQATTTTTRSRAAVSPVPGSPVLIGEEGFAENSNVVSMVNLRRNEEEDNTTTVSQESDVSSNSTQTSDTPLLGMDEPNVEVMPYSPQVEVAIESLMSPANGAEA